MKDEICKHCGVPIKIGANSKFCDHYGYPENCNTCRSKKEEYDRVISNIKYNLDQTKDRVSKNYGDSTIKWIISILDHLAEEKREGGIS